MDFWAENHWTVHKTEAEVSWDEFVLKPDDVFASRSLLIIPKPGMLNTVGVNYSNMTHNSIKKEIVQKGPDARSYQYFVIINYCVPLSWNPVLVGCPVHLTKAGRHHKLRSYHIKTSLETARLCRWRKWKVRRKAGLMKNQTCATFLFRK